MTTTITATAIWDALTDQWRTTIRAKGLAALTERDYIATARRWARWLENKRYNLEPKEVRSCHVDDFIAEINVATSPANGAHHYRNLRVFFAWLAKRKEIAKDANPMEETEPPSYPEKMTPVLTDDEHGRLMATCDGRDFLSLRDAAIILLFRDTGIRVAELATIPKDGIRLNDRRVKVLGKGGTERWVGFGADTCLALARYLKARGERERQPCATLWLNRRGRQLTVSGIQDMLNRRGQQADIDGSVHPHRFRHDFSHRWKLAGGSDEGLMTIGGWSSPKMPRHYGKAARTERALAEQQRIGLVGRAS